MKLLRIGSLLTLVAASLQFAACDKPSADSTPPSSKPNYDPCADLSCGESCSVCPPDEPGCVETAIPKQCDSAGQCTDSAVECEGEDPAGDDAATDYDSCAGKSCGDSCTLCAPDDGDCVETAVVKQCNAAGECSDQAAACGT